MQLEIKKDPAVVAVAIAALVVIGVLRARDAITWEQAIGALVLLGIPSLFGKTGSGGGSSKPPTTPPAASVLVVFALGAALNACASSPAQPAPTPQEKAEFAEKSYEAEHVACVDKAKTLEESKACRERVRQKWGRADGGAEGGLNER